MTGKWCLAEGGVLVVLRGYLFLLLAAVILIFLLGVVLWRGMDVMWLGPCKVGVRGLDWVPDLGSAG